MVMQLPRQSRGDGRRNFDGTVEPSHTYRSVLHCAQPNEMLQHAIHQSNRRTL
jgi:hypothetical protein